GPYEVEVYQAPDGVRLTGYAASEADRARMVSIADELSGKRTIIENITIRPSPARVVLRTPLPPADSEILAAVRQTLDQLKSAEALQIEKLEVQSGVVALKGDAQSFRTVDQLLARVFTLPGVEDVHSEITVRGQNYMSDWQQYQR